MMVDYIVGYQARSHKVFTVGRIAPGATLWTCRAKNLWQRAAHDGRINLHDVRVHGCDRGKKMVDVGFFRTG